MAVRWREVDAGYETPCWEWLLKRNWAGYGVATASASGSVGAHRVVYEELVGPIPDSMQLDHLRQNRACVNPAHLEPVTPAENTRRSKAAKLSAVEVEQVRALAVAGALMQAEIAQRFGITQPHVSQIKNGRRWADAA